MAKAIPRCSEGSSECSGPRRDRKPLSTMRRPCEFGVRIRCCVTETCEMYSRCGNPRREHLFIWLRGAADQPPLAFFRSDQAVIRFQTCGDGLPDIGLPRAEVPVRQSFNCPRCPSENARKAVFPATVEIETGVASTLPLPNLHQLKCVGRDDRLLSKQTANMPSTQSTVPTSTKEIAGSPCFDKSRLPSKSYTSILVC